jgi:hypothetical protein
MPLVLGGSTVVAAAYDIDNSCRFDDASSAGLAKTFGTPTDRDKWTFSTWFKVCNFEEQGLFWAEEDGSNYTFMALEPTGKFTFFGLLAGGASPNFKPSRTFKDVGAWYHFVIGWDSGQAVAENRIKFYVNGTQYTGPFGTEIYPAQDANSSINGAQLHEVAEKDSTAAHNMNGYMSEVVFIDGTQYAASDFGEFDSASPTIWKPKDVSGLTFGNNGFHLDFGNSADLGADVSGNSNDFTPSGLTASDQAVDTPTNNFSTMNSLDNYFAAGTFSEGNCNVVHPSSSNNAFCTSTIWLSSGKWYAEAKVITTGTGDGNLIGMSSVVSPASSNAGSLGETTANYGYLGQDGKYRYNAVSTSYGSTYTTNAIIGIYLDLDNNKLYFAEDGTIQASGTGITITAASLQPSGLYTMAGGDWTSSTGVQWAWNFGGCSAFDVTSANQDVNGYGNFEYSPNDGGSASFDGSAKDFLAICTKNLGSDGG